MSKRSRRSSKEVHEQADAILADDPDSPWGLYTRANAHLLDREAAPRARAGDHAPPTEEV